MLLALSAKDEARISIMAKHYIIAALWADAPEGTNPRATKVAYDKAFADCLSFCIAAGPNLLREVERRHSEGYGNHPDYGNESPVFAAMGHDFWLTRNGHGVGFWDRAELEQGLLGEKLTKISEDFGEANPEFYRGWLYL